jgi:hypothetical protein
MRQCLFAAFLTCLWWQPACAGPGGVAIAVIDFEYVNTSGEQRDEAREHETRRTTFMAALRADLGRQSKFRLVTPTCRPDPCTLSGATPADLLAASRRAGADFLILGGIHKMSTLVQWAKVEAIDVRTERVPFDKLFTFRGDTDDSWQLAEKFISEEIIAAHAP